MDLAQKPPALPATARVVVDLAVTPEEFASLVLLIKTAAEGIDPDAQTWVMHRHDFEVRSAVETGLDHD